MTNSEQGAGEPVRCDICDEDKCCGAYYESGDRLRVAAISALQAKVADLEKDKKTAQDLAGTYKQISDTAEAQVDKHWKRIGVLEVALEEISKGRGSYSRDPLIHASNTIAEMKALALEALRPSQGDKQP